AGQISVSFLVSSQTVNTSTTGTVTASIPGGSLMAALTVLPPGLGTLTIVPNGIDGGHPVTGTVTLTGAAPVGAALVTLRSSGPAATVPTSITIPPGATSGTFTIVTHR